MDTGGHTSGHTSGATVLVANRGEIASRVFRTARRLGMRCAAVYSDADRDAAFVREADAAERIGPAPAAESYLRVDAIVDAALRMGATFVHPGYGFLAEDAAFAEACAKAGLTFVGPPPEVLALMGAKDEAKRAAVAAGVEVLPGYDGEDPSEGAFARAAGEIGYPVIVKPAAGGGGKGMAVVHTADELPAALASARRVAIAAFGDDRLLLERYLPEPRHVEVQVLADAHGTVLHLGERDCSLQRRHQKVIEESPSPFVEDTLRAKLCDSAVRLARHTGYVNAGTCEFLVDGSGGFGFIEMNARLQVEHPVTEAVTGLDLVELQFRVAAGEPLGVAQEHISFDGHAVEARVYAEDPDEGFLPQAGRVLHVAWPPVRVDAGVEAGGSVTAAYDPMIAKIVVHAPGRREAFAALDDALSRTEILGPRTNVAFLRALARHPDVLEARHSTGWIADAMAGWRGRPQPVPEPAVAVAAVAAALAARPLADRDPWTSTGPWRIAGAAPIPVVLRPDGDERLVRVAGEDPWVALGIDVRRAEGANGFDAGGRHAAAVAGEGVVYVWMDDVQFEIPSGPRERRADEAGHAHLGAPMPGQVIAVRVAAGERVTRGQELVVVEAMKMEHAVLAPSDGIVETVQCAVGDQVERGQSLVDFEPA